MPEGVPVLSREISPETQRVIDLYKDSELEEGMNELMDSVDLSDTSKNIEILSKYLRSASWYPVCHYALKNKLIDPKDLYKAFLPSFVIGNSPAQLVGLRNLLSLLLKDRVLDMQQVMAFVDGLSEGSDIEVLWAMASNAPIEPTNKRVLGMKIDGETSEEPENGGTVNPNEAAHLMSYGNSQTWKDDAIGYLTSIVKRGD